MRRIPTFVLALLLCFNFSITAFAQNGRADIIKKEVKEKSETITIDLQIPVIKAGPDLKIQNKLNNELRRKVMDFKSNIERQAAEAPTPYEAVSRYSVSYNENNLLSLTLELYSYTGGAHGFTERISYNIDLASGKQYKLKDLFKNDCDYEYIINNNIKKIISEATEGQYFPDAFKGISKDQPYYITDEGIVIYFGLYEIAPYASGFPEFKIPFDAIKNCIKPDIMRR